MKEGIIESKEQSIIAEFLINNGYDPYHVTPLCCIQSDPSIYGLTQEDDKKTYLSVHLMDTWDCLEHPGYRESPQVIRQRFTSDLDPVPIGLKDGNIFLDSFEVWKFIDLYLKSSIVSYEMLYLPNIHCDGTAYTLLDLMRSGITNRIGKVVRGMAVHTWPKVKDSYSKTILTYYRLMQAIFFLKEEEFEWNINILLEYMKPSGIVKMGESLIKEFSNKEKIKDNSIIIGNEIHQLIDEVDRARITTTLPEKTPKEICNRILEVVKETRGNLF